MAVVASVPPRDGRDGRLPRNNTAKQAPTGSLRPPPPAMSRERPLISLADLPPPPPPSYAAAHDEEEERDAPPKKWYHYLPLLSTSANCKLRVREATTNSKLLLQLLLS